MNVCSLELAKELYELSGWDDTAFAYSHGKPFLQEELKYQAHLIGFTPAYDLGYLLRKLPDFTYAKKQRGRFAFSVEGPLARRGRLSWFDTPEDAAARLAIELFKQGVLKPQPQQRSEQS